MWNYMCIRWLINWGHHHHHHHHHPHHKHQGLGPLIRSVFRVTAARANASSVFQFFSFLVVCSGMILKGFGFVAFFASVKASSVCRLMPKPFNYSVFWGGETLYLCRTGPRMGPLLIFRFTEEWMRSIGVELKTVRENPKYSEWHLSQWHVFFHVERSPTFVIRNQRLFSQSNISNLRTSVSL